MANQFKEFIQFLKSLENQEVEYILVGGVAVILHGMERLTRDVDIFVKMEEKNIARLRKALSSLYDDSSIQEITLKELDDYAVIRFGTPTDFAIDLIARLGEVATFEDLESETILYEGTPIKIATPESLYHLKKDTIRPKDKIDAMFLHEIIKERQKKKK